MRKARGFTLLELVVVIIVLGILGAIAIPKYMGIRKTAITTAKTAATDSIRSVYTMAMLVLKQYPSVKQLSDYVHAEANLEGAKVADKGTGIEVVIDKRTYLVPTYIDTACSTQTANDADIVQCVGFINNTASSSHDQVVLPTKNEKITLEEYAQTAPSTPPEVGTPVAAPLTAPPVPVVLLPAPPNSQPQATAAAAVPIPTGAQSPSNSGSAKGETPLFDNLRHVGNYVWNTVVDHPIWTSTLTGLTVLAGTGAYIYSYFAGHYSKLSDSLKRIHREGITRASTPSSSSSSSTTHSFIPFSGGFGSSTLGSFLPLVREDPNEALIRLAFSKWKSVLHEREREVLPLTTEEKAALGLLSAAPVVEEALLPPVPSPVPVVEEAPAPSQPLATPPLSPPTPSPMAGAAAAALPITVTAGDRLNAAKKRLEAAKKETARAAREKNNAEIRATRENKEATNAERKAKMAAELIAAKEKVRKAREAEENARRARAIWVAAIAKEVKAARELEKAARAARAEEAEREKADKKKAVELLKLKQKEATAEAIRSKNAKMKSKAKEPGAAAAPATSSSNPNQKSTHPFLQRKRLTNRKTPSEAEKSVSAMKPEAAAASASSSSSRTPVRTEKAESKKTVKGVIKSRL